jgi:hypothetical protein
VLWAFAGLYAYEWAVNVALAVAAVAGHDVRLDSSGRLTDTSHLSGWLTAAAIATADVIWVSFVGARCSAGGTRRASATSPAR